MTIRRMTATVNWHGIMFITSGMLTVHQRDVNSAVTSTVATGEGRKVKLKVVSVALGEQWELQSLN